MSSVYLSAPKTVLLAAIEQYCKHYDWGPHVLSSMAQLLIHFICEPSQSEVGWTELCQRLGNIEVGSQTLQELLSERLEHVLQSLDELHGFFDELQQLIVDTDAAAGMEGDLEMTLLDSESPFGVFVRRCSLAFRQLEFHQIGELLGECKQALLALQGKDNYSGRSMAPTMTSQTELQEHIEHHIRQLEEECGAPAPAKMEKEVKDAARNLPDYSRLHYLQYLSMVRMGECEQSEEALRRFFDRNATKDVHTTYQYALLYLAAMQAQLGMTDEARKSLAEATQVARDGQDHICLLYIACWEMRLLPSHQQTTSKMQDLITKAAAMGCHELQASGLIQLAELAGASAREAFDSLMQARALVVEHNIDRQNNAWLLAAGRVWLRNGSSGKVSMARLYTQMAGKSRQKMTERERTEQSRLLDQINSSDQKPHQQQQQKLDEIRQLMDDGYDGEAKELLTLIVSDNDNNHSSGDFLQSQAMQMLNDC